MAVPSPLLTTPSSKPAPSMIPPINKTPSAAATFSASWGNLRQSSRREVAISMTTAGFLAAAYSMIPEVLLPPASAASDEEYVRETEEVISKVRLTMSKDKTDPNVASAVDDLRDASNSWVAKYRREKSLLGRPSFRDMYSALNAVSGHYISFGPTAPIPAKRKARILEEVETAEKALLRGR